jgi:endonuclease/exonuclease/phosphatase family metal-dependent hydrolase
LLSRARGLLDQADDGGSAVTAAGIMRQEHDGEMRFVTLNTWGMRGNWAARLPVLREAFRALDADIVTDTSVCYRDAWESAHPGEPVATYIPENPNQADPDWPFRGIDHVLVRCGHSGPTLLIGSCRRIFDQGRTSVSDHYGLLVELDPPAHRGQGSGMP